MSVVSGAGDVRLPKPSSLTITTETNQRAAYVLEPEEQRRTSLLPFARHGPVQSPAAPAVSALVHRRGSDRLGGVCVSALPPQPVALTANRAMRPPFLAGSHHEPTSPGRGTVSKGVLVSSKVTLEFHRLGQALQIFLTRNRNGAESLRNGRQQLDVEQTEASLAQMPVQVEQGNFRSVVRIMEH